MPFIGSAWRQLAFQQQLIREHARLQMRSVIASRMYDYLGQFQQRTAERLAKVEERLAAYQKQSENTPQSGSQPAAVRDLISELAKEQPVTPKVLNKALADRGMDELPATLASGAIASYYLK
jgi:hypothetical protein